MKMKEMPEMFIHTLSKVLSKEFESNDIDCAAHLLRNLVLLRSPYTFSRSINQNKKYHFCLFNLIHSKYTI